MAVAVPFCFSLSSWLRLLGSGYVAPFYKLVPASYVGKLLHAFLTSRVLLGFDLPPLGQTAFWALFSRHDRGRPTLHGWWPPITLRYI
jgi:hypothetical protein